MHNTNPVPQTDSDWRTKLTPEQYRVLREAGTEMPGTGVHLHESRTGTYTCVGCAAELFKSATKFNAGCGWPSFCDAITAGAVTLRTDTSHGMTRTEVLCANCHSHLGHRFDDGYGTPTGQRYCINSVALEFHPETS